MKQFTKDSLISELISIKNQGWIESTRLYGETGNSGAVGNTLETLLGITENNLPIPNAAEWELKAQRRRTSSLVTLLHQEPSPTGLTLVSNLLLPKYGWPHKSKVNELSFRQTITANRFSDRGFSVILNEDEQKLEISFNAQYIDSRHIVWKNSVEQRVGLSELNPQPYWGYGDLGAKLKVKLKNTFFVFADSKKQNGREYFWYNGVIMLQSFSFQKFRDFLGTGIVYVDFDARTGHNHGTKFRLRQSILPLLFDSTVVIFNEPQEPAALKQMIDVSSVRPLAPVIQEEDLQVAANEAESGEGEEVF